MSIENQLSAVSVDTLQSKMVRDKTSQAGLSQLKTKLLPFLYPTIAETEADIVSFTDSVSAYERRERDAIADIARLKEQAVKHKRQAKEYRQRTKESKKALAVAKKTAKVDSKLIERLRKHKSLQYATVTPSGAVILYFRPLWVMSQIDSESKTRVRTFIGCYRVTLTPGTNVDMKVENLTFGSLGHWSVNSEGRPCWGDWQDSVRGLWREGKLHDLVTLLSAYFMSYEDGSAYSRTYRFRASRKDYMQVKNLPREQYETTEELPVGTVVINTMTITDREDTSLQHLPFKTIRSGGSRAGHFMVPVHCSTHNASRDTGEPDRDWYLDYQGLVLNSSQTAELETYLESIKDLGSEERREQTRVWCQGMLARQNVVVVPTKQQLCESLLKKLDEAETLPYAQVAQPLVIDYKKIAV